MASRSGEVGMSATPVPIPPKRRSLWRRVERALLGSVMAVGAFVIERQVLRAVRRRGQAPVSGGGERGS